MRGEGEVGVKGDTQDGGRAVERDGRIVVDDLRRDVRLVAFIRGEEGDVRFGGGDGKALPASPLVHVSQVSV
jgi:hypothetical protein